MSDKRNTHRCTVCNVETLSSRACPKCGRRSTLVPLNSGDRSSNGDGVEEANRSTSLGVGHSNPEPGYNLGQRNSNPRNASNIKLIALVSATFVVIVASLAGLVISLTYRNEDKNRKEQVKTKGPQSGNLRQSLKQRRSRDVRMNRRPEEKRAVSEEKTKCGFGYCVKVFIYGDVPPEDENGNVPPDLSRSPKVEEGDAPPVGGSEKGMVTEHCFLLERTPSEKRWWYVPVKHEMSAKYPNGSKRVLFNMTPNGVRLPARTDSLRLKSMRHGAAIKNGMGKGILGSRLFYLGETPHGFALASLPRVSGFVKNQMLLQAITATSLMPLPKDTEVKSWVDDRPIPPLMRQSSETLRITWTREEPDLYRLKTKTDDKKNKTSGKKTKKKPSPETTDSNSRQTQLPKIQGTVELNRESGRMKKARLSFHLPGSKRKGLKEIKGRIEVESRKEVCVSN